MVSFHVGLLLKKKTKKQLIFCGTGSIATWKEIGTTPDGNTRVDSSLVYYQSQLLEYGGRLPSLMMDPILWSFNFGDFVFFVVCSLLTDLVC
jgi:hypothetical protein